MLYLIKSGEYIKVGFSRDVLSLKKRMESYKTHNPNVLLLGLCEGTAEDECNYHRKLDAYKLYNRAEWFKQEALPLIVDDFKSGEIVDEFNAYFNKRTGEGGYPQLIKYYIMTKDPSYELEYPEFKEIVKYLKESEMNTLGWNKEKMLKAVEDKKMLDKVFLEVHSVGFISRKDLKKRMSEVFKKYGINLTAKASLVEQCTFYSVEEKYKRINGKLIKGYELGPKRLNFELQESVYQDYPLSDTQVFL